MGEKSKEDDTEVVPPKELRATEDKRQANNPLHGVTLERMLEELVAKVGWEEMGRAVPVRCFRFEPSVKSSLVFLRRTPWARKEVEGMYLRRIINDK